MVSAGVSPLLHKRSELAVRKARLPSALLWMLFFVPQRLLANPPIEETLMGADSVIPLGTQLAGEVEVANLLTAGYDGLE